MVVSVWWGMGKPLVECMVVGRPKVEKGDGVGYVEYCTFSLYFNARIVISGVSMTCASKHLTYLGGLIDQMPLR